MSADNGVYILVSRGRKTRKGYQKEYRVIHAQAIENITWQPDYPDYMVQDSELNRSEVLAYFGNARVFTDRRIAEGYAQRIFDEVMEGFGIVEYGIVWFDEFAHIPFPKPQSSRRRHPQVQRTLGKLAVR